MLLHQGDLLDVSQPDGAYLLCMVVGYYVHACNCSTGWQQGYLALIWQQRAGCIPRGSCSVLTVVKLWTDIGNAGSVVLADWEASAESRIAL